MKRTYKYKQSGCEMLQEYFEKYFTWLLVARIYIEDELRGEFKRRCAMLRLIYIQQKRVV